MPSQSTFAALLLALGCATGSGGRPQGAGSSAGGDSARENALIVAVPEPEADPAPAAHDAPRVPTLEGDSGWTQFHGDAARRGASTAPAIEKPKLAWRTRVGIQGWLNSPVVIGKTVLVPSSGRVHNAPDPEDGLSALDLESGKRFWFAPLSGDANGVAADGQRAYVSSDDGHLYAVWLKNGSVAWRQPGKGKVYSHPLLIGGLVVVGDAAGYLRAFDVKSGAVVWTTQLSGAIRGGASADDKHIYAVSEAGELAALTWDGKVSYRKVLKRPAWDGKGPDQPIQAYSPPIVTPTSLIVPFARETYYNDRPALLAVAKNGSPAWAAKGPGDWGNVRSTPVLVGDLLIYAEPYSGDVASISSATGRVVYRHTLGVCYFPQWASPAAAQDVVYLMRFDGVVHALRATDGKARWRFYLGDSTRAGANIPPQLEPSGQCDWDVPTGTGHPAYSPLAIAGDGTLLAGTHEGFLYAIRDAKPSP